MYRFCRDKNYVALFNKQLKNLAHSIKSIIYNNVFMVDFNCEKFNSTTHCHVCEKQFTPDKKCKYAISAI